MNRQFANSRLVLATENPTSQKKSRISLNNLIENAPGQAVKVVTDTIDQLTQDSVEKVSAIVHYDYI